MQVQWRMSPHKIVVPILRQTLVTHETWMARPSVIAETRTLMTCQLQPVHLALLEVIDSRSLRGCPTLSLTEGARCLPLALFLKGGKCSARAWRSEHSSGRLSSSAYSWHDKLIMIGIERTDHGLDYAKL